MQPVSCWAVFRGSRGLRVHRVCTGSVERGRGLHMHPLRDWKVQGHDRGHDDWGVRGLSRRDVFNHGGGHNVWVVHRMRGGQIRGSWRLAMLGLPRESVQRRWIGGVHGLSIVVSVGGWIVLGQVSVPGRVPSRMGAEFAPVVHVLKMRDRAVHSRRSRGGVSILRTGQVRRGVAGIRGRRVHGVSYRDVFEHEWGLHVLRLLQGVLRSKHGGYNMLNVPCRDNSCSCQGISVRVLRRWQLHRGRSRQRMFPVHRGEICWHGREERLPDVRSGDVR